MEEKKISLAIGSLLHDLGKLLCSNNDGSSYSQKGYEFVKEQCGVNNKEILNCIRYNYSDDLANANIEKNDICYITHIADNIAAFSDRYQGNGTGNSVRNIAYEPVFNVLGSDENLKKYKYEPTLLGEDDNINFPTEKEVKFSESFYSKVIDNIKHELKDIEFSNSCVNSILEILESNTVYIPSSTNSKELEDISFYDHVKMTAALALCIYDYVCEKGIEDYKEALFSKAESFYDEEAFLIYCADISGIQRFIYTISSDGALKGLRARSFYLEIIMESIIDELLDRMDLPRCNVLYTGGGHTYIILPNTEKAKNILKNFKEELDKWFINNFGIDLAMSSGFSCCSANSMRNKPNGSYNNIFKEISNCINNEKAHRYSADEIIKLNHEDTELHERECKICKRTDNLNAEDVCGICKSLKELSDAIINKDAMYSVVKNIKKGEKGIILPFDKYFVADESNEALKERMAGDNYVRGYCKNKGYSGKSIVKKIWVGDYHSDKEFSKLAKKSNGIKRIAVLRADIDNLGQTFVKGFGEKYTTISRTATFSREMSIFFKYHINSILKNPKYYIPIENKSEKRNAVIVYSGGDDVFLVGSWDDVIGAAVDLQRAVSEYTCGKVTISAGIGIFKDKYPISLMAEITGELEDYSKKREGKNAVTLFDNKEECRFGWEELTEKVIGEKLGLLNELFSDSERGKNFLYNMLELIRENKRGDNKENKLSLARFAYMLSRLKPRDDASEKEKNVYKKFSSNVYKWICSDSKEDINQLIMAIYLYAYINRENTNQQNENNKEE